MTCGPEMFGVEVDPEGVSHTGATALALHR